MDHSPPAEPQDYRLRTALQAIAAPAEDAEPVHASPQWEIFRLRTQLAYVRRVAREALEP